MFENTQIFPALKTIFLSRRNIRFNRGNQGLSKQEAASSRWLKKSILNRVSNSIFKRKEPVL